MKMMRAIGWFFIVFVGLGLVRATIGFLSHAQLPKLHWNFVLFLLFLILLGLAVLGLVKSRKRSKPPGI